MEKQKPRIALIGPVHPFRGGISHYTSHLASHLLQDGFPVAIFSFRRQYPSWLYPGETDRDPSLEPIQSEAQYNLDPLYPWTWVQCIRLIQQFKPDLVLFPWWTTFWGMAFAYLLWALKRKGINTAVLVHNVLPHEAKPWDRWITKITLRQTDQFIVQTSEQGAKLKEIHPGAKIAQAPHPVYDQFPNQRMDQRDARAQLHLPLDGKLLLFFGIVRPYKGLANLIDAMSELRKDHEPVHLVVTGEFWEPLEKYRAQIQSLGLNEAVTIFPGYATNESLPLYFSAADLLVAPYIGGTQSGSVKLAMGFGIPVLVSRTITDELLLRYEGQGVTISSLGTTQMLAQDIRKALNSAPAGLKLKEAIDSSWKDMIQKIVSFTD